MKAFIALSLVAAALSAPTPIGLSGSDASSSDSIWSGLANWGSGDAAGSSSTPASNTTSTASTTSTAASTATSGGSDSGLAGWFGGMYPDYTIVLTRRHYTDKIASSPSSASTTAASATSTATADSSSALGGLSGGM